jgi:hypothetical protein
MRSEPKTGKEKTMAKKGSMDPEDKDFRIFPTTEAEWKELEQAVREGDEVVELAERAIREGMAPEHEKLLKRAIKGHRVMKKLVRKIQRRRKGKAA